MEPTPIANVQGEQQGNADQFARLAEQMQGINANIDAWFNVVDGRLNAFDVRFNFIDETLAAILACLGNQRLKLIIFLALLFMNLLDYDLLFLLELFVTKLLLISPADSEQF